MMVVFSREKKFTADGKSLKDLEVHFVPAFLEFPAIT
jgi:hypothetical protein